MARPAQSLAGFLEPRDPRLGPGLMCEEHAVRQRARKRQRWRGVARAGGRDMEQEDQRPNAGWGAEAWAIKRKMLGGEKMVETVAETDRLGGEREGGGRRKSLCWIQRGGGAGSERVREADGAGVRWEMGGEEESPSQPETEGRCRNADRDEQRCGQTGRNPGCTGGGEQRGRSQAVRGRVQDRGRGGRGEEDNGGRERRQTPAAHAGSYPSVRSSDSIASTQSEVQVDPDDERKIRSKDSQRRRRDQTGEGKDLGMSL